MTGRITSKRIHVAPYWLGLAVWNVAEDLSDDFEMLELERHTGQAIKWDAIDEDLMSYQPDFVSCVFHVGFLSVPESGCQLERLRNEAPLLTNSPVRSAFLRMLERGEVTPIDATAAKVGGDYGR
jgi:hypothetical protein